MRLQEQGKTEQAKKDLGKLLGINGYFFSFLFFFGPFDRADIILICISLISVYLIGAFIYICIVNLTSFIVIYI